MEINVKNINRDNRKELVATISFALLTEPVYKGVPSFDYVIDNFTVKKDGTISFSDTVPEDKVLTVKRAIKDAGFDFDGREEVPDLTIPDGVLTISMPREKLTDKAIENLNRIIESKGSLIKKALGISELTISVNENEVSFPWFTDKSADAASAYMHFVTALCEMATTQRNVTAKEREVENEKYAFRCFLLRLGFIGNEYKNDRRILLQNLSGSSAFKTTKGGDEHDVPKQEGC